MKQQQKQPRRRMRATVLPMLMVGAFLALAPESHAQQSAGIDPSIPSSNGGGTQQGSYGLLLSTIGEPLTGNETVSATDETTWTGFWQVMPLDGTSGVQEEWKSGNPGETRIMSVYPNPFDSEVRITIALEHSGRVKLGLYDLLGQEVVRLVDGEREAGMLRVNWQPGAIDAGTYVLRIEVNGRRYPAEMVRYVR